MYVSFVEYNNSFVENSRCFFLLLFLSLLSRYFLLCSAVLLSCRTHCPAGGWAYVYHILYTSMQCETYRHTQVAFMSLSFLLEEKIVHKMNCVYHCGTYIQRLCLDSFSRLLMLMHTFSRSFKQTPSLYTPCVYHNIFSIWTTYFFFTREQIFFCRGGRSTFHILFVFDITNPMRINLSWKSNTVSKSDRKLNFRRKRALIWSVVG